MFTILNSCFSELKLCPTLEPVYFAQLQTFNKSVNVKNYSCLCRFMRFLFFIYKLSKICIHVRLDKPLPSNNVNMDAKRVEK